MEKGEILDEIFDLNPIFPDIYSIKPQNSNKEMRPKMKMQVKRLMKSSPLITSSWNNNNNNPAKLISFEKSNSNSNSNSNTNTDDTAAADLDTASAADYSPISSDIINFSSRSSAIDDIHDSMNQQKMQYSSSTTRTPSQALDHVMAERKRRQNLSQLFISLSKAVPGLKKLDKASLLEDGINYLKTLQERVGVLEEEEEMRRSSTATEDSNSSSEIQARISDDKRHVLIKILHCNKDKEMGGLMSRINPSQIMEKMHLNVVDMRIMPFGAALHITILAQMQGEFEVSVKDIVDHLHTLFRVDR